MTPAVCRVRHDPAAGKYGDCIRACIATVLDLDTEDVPHFVETGQLDQRHMRQWLSHRHLTPFITHYPGSVTRDELLEMQGDVNPDAIYILFGGTGSGDHCVVCHGGKVVHNPAWYGCSIIGPLSSGVWQIMVLGRV